MKHAAIPDAGSIVLGWLTKLVLGISLLGIVLFDGAALVRTNVNAADHANTAALAAVEVYKQTKDVQAAFTAAESAVAASGAVLDPTTFLADPSTGRIRLEVTEEAVTLWLHKAGPLKKYVTVHASGQASPSP